VFVSARTQPLSEVSVPWRWAFEEAWASWIAGSMGIGSVLVDADGSPVVRGRNRVLESPLSGPISGSLLAHAEMDSFAALGLRTAEGLTLFTTVEPCLMCSATAIAMRLSHVRYASPDPVFEGLSDVLGGHPYASERTPTRQPLGHAMLAAVGHLLPLANRVWSRPGIEPREEWLRANSGSWHAALELVGSGTMSALAARRAPVDEMIEAVGPALLRHGAT
jgi:tRNA(Arg) A34 adenosine deaminase TadA